MGVIRFVTELLFALIGVTILLIGFLVVATLLNFYWSTTTW